MSMEDSEDNIVFEVVINHEEQYSIWPQFKGEPPKGWRTAGKSGLKQDCLAYIKEVWTDMRPLSLRLKMKEMEAMRPELERRHAEKVAQAKLRPPDPRDNLVDFLATDLHPVEVSLRPEKNLGLFRKALDRDYVHIKFTDTRGGTELGVKLDRSKCDFSKADLENGKGRVVLEGGLTLDYVKVLCKADIDIETLEGKGKLEKVEA